MTNIPDVSARANETIHIDLIELGAAKMLEAIIAVARTTLLQQTGARAPSPVLQPFTGFVQALVEHRQPFTHDVVAKILAEHGSVQ